jgi:hypothetical protein
MVMPRRSTAEPEKRLSRAGALHLWFQDWDGAERDPTDTELVDLLSALDRADVPPGKVTVDLSTLEVWHALLLHSTPGLRFTDARIGVVCAEIASLLEGGPV